MTKVKLTPKQVRERKRLVQGMASLSVGFMNTFTDNQDRVAAAWLYLFENYSRIETAVRAGKQANRVKQDPFLTNWVVGWERLLNSPEEIIYRFVAIY